MSTMAKPEFYATNRNGSEGPDVSLIQIWLNGVSAKYPCINKVDVDGKYGSKTQDSVTRFQCVTGLSMDGVVGTQTWDALYNHYASVVGPGEQYPGLAMRNGQAGATVKSAQMQLNTHSANLQADGKFGSKTEQAVRDFQHTHGQSVDGVIGPNTWAALY